MSSSEVSAAVPDEGTGLRSFMDEVFQAFQRSEQRRWAQAYLWALLHASGKKTPRSMALATSLPPAAAHGLHQFINASPWDWAPVRHRLARRVAETATPYAWTVAELLIPKRGEHSVGVHRRVDRVTGRTVNCQRALGLLLAAGGHCYPVDWSLVLGGGWNADPERMRRARIPAAEAGRTVADHVVGYAAGVAAQPCLADLPWVLDLTRCDDAAGVLAGLARHGVDVVCEVSPDQPVLADPHSPAVTTVRALTQVRRARYTQVLLRHGPDGREVLRAVPVHAYAATVRVPGPGGVDGARAYRALERPDPQGRRPARYWLTTLTGRRVEDVLRLARGHTAALTAVAALGRFGVLDFEGRSFPGWHHHMTMASAAYVYRRLTRSTGSVVPEPPHAPPDAPSCAPDPPGALTGARN
ncbi:transposase [Streptomyces lusitanus]|uniref:Transposase n=1 Tax=Streptomyces lusitanus TaxID=68232 RepID=A0ABU3JLF0_9ACTN|nr:transposase [Streptomyces lusitanus]